jgi:suppressor for copper-sensitivity B
MPIHPRAWLSILGLLIAVFFAGPLAAQGVATQPQDEEGKPKLQLNVLDNLLGPPDLGEKVSFFGSFTIEKGSRRGVLTVSAQIEPEWHIYSITQPGGVPATSTVLTPAPTASYKLLGPFQPDRAPEIKKIEGFTGNSEEHHDQVAWHAPIELAEGVQPETLTIKIKASAQACKNACIQVDADVDAAFSGFTEPSKSPGEYHPPATEAEVVLKGHIEPAAVAPGGKAKLVLTATPTKGWHIYPYSIKDPDTIGNKPTLIHLSPLPGGWTRSAATASAKPKGGHHEEPVSWTIELSIPADSPQGESVVSGYVGFQTCKNAGACLFPHAVQFRAPLAVRAKTEAGTIPVEFFPVNAADKAAPVKGYKDVAKLAAEHPAPSGEIDVATLLPMIGFGLLGGLILNLMPCVLPVIGLKVLSFVQQGGQSRARIFALNFWFAAGLIAVFLVLATAAAFANLSWGQQFTFTWFKVAMVVVVFAFALSFLGVWEVPIPGFAQSKASSKLQQQEGPTGAFFKGVFTTLLATPCSGPFLGPVFGYTLAQPPLATYLLFASVGLGMASPYLVIGAFPALVRWLPKPGEWMETFKQVMGFILLFTVVYLFSTISSDYYIATLTLVIGVWFACWLIGRVPIYEDAGKQIRQWSFGVAAAAAVGWVAFTFLGPVKHLYEWQPYTPDAIAKLQSEGKTVMVDFTADWCLTCQLNFRAAINTRRVKEVVEKNQVVPLLADWTDKNDTIKQKLAELNSNSIPVLAIYPADKPGEVIVLRDALLERQVLAALDQAGPSKPEDKPAATAVTAMANP